jgi:hypothetical protein
MDVIDMDKKSIIKKIIKDNIKERNIEKLDAGLAIAIDERIDSNLILKGYEKLGDFFAEDLDFREAMLAYEKGRILNPYNIKLVKKELNLIISFWNDKKSKLVQRDITLFQNFLEFFLLDYRRFLASPDHIWIIQKCEDILAELYIQSELSPNIYESEVSFFLSQLTSLRYDHLSPEEIRKKVAKVLGDKIRELTKEEEQQKKKKN